MQGRKFHGVKAQRGVSLSGLIFVLAIVGVAALFALKVVPSYIEYRSIQSAIERAKAAGGTPHEMQATYDKFAEVNNVSTIRGRDLVITREGGEPELSFAYEKRIPLAGKVSLLIDYAGTTDKSGLVAAKADAAAQ